MNISPEKISNKLREMNGKEIANIFVKSKRLKQVKKEFRAGGRLCDIAYLDSNGFLNAIEIKSNGDKIEQAEQQCKDYMEWSDLVWLLIESRKMKELDKIKLDNRVGIIVFIKGVFKTHKKAQLIKHKLNDYISIMTGDQLKGFARSLGTGQGKTKQEAETNILSAANQNNIMGDSSSMKTAKKLLFS